MNEDEALAAAIVETDGLLNTSTIYRHLFQCGLAYARAEAGEAPKLPWQSMETAPRRSDQLFIVRNIRLSATRMFSGEDLRLVRFQPEADENDSGTCLPDRWEFMTYLQINGWIDERTMHNWQWLDTSAQESATPLPAAVPVELRPRSTRKMGI